MKQVTAEQGSVQDSTYNQLTRVPECLCQDRVTFTSCQPLESLLLGELDAQDGTDEWRAWILRCAARHGMT